MELTVEDKLILATARLNLTDEEIRLIDELILLVKNWEYFTVNVMRNNLGPLVYKNFSFVKNYSDIPSGSISELKQTYYNACNRNEIFYKHFHDFVKVLSGQGIPIIALKGIFLAETIYTDIGLRPMSDIDILVRKEDARNCVNIFHDLAYSSHERHKTKFTSKYYDRKHLPPMVSGNISVEIHLNAHSENCEYNVNIDDYWENAKTSSICEAKSLALSPNNILQYLCLHLDYHFNSGNIQFLMYCDIAEVLKFYQSEINWDSFDKSCEKYNCSKNVYRHLYLAHKYFSASLPDDIISKANVFSDEQTENLFILYLQDNKNLISKAISHSTVVNLRKVKGTGNKLLYLFHDVFPSISFMRKRYRKKNIFVIFWYYLVRFKTGVVALFRYMAKAK